METPSDSRDRTEPPPEAPRSSDGGEAPANEPRPGESTPTSETVTGPTQPERVGWEETRTMTALRQTIDDDAVQAAPAELIGRLLGDYEVNAEIARGGMGIVYKATQLRLHRPVALKLIRAAQFASDREIRRFHREAQIIASLEHPHIVPIYDIEEADGLHYYSMPLMSGGSLRTAAPRLKGNGRAIAEVLIEVARAVHHAHRYGVLHRDLKPSNVLLDESGRPFVADFGLAQHFDPDGTISGLAGGTPGYMAPEQIDPENRTLTTATDIYALGAMLYALLVARPPFQSGTTRETIRRIREDLPEPPRSIDPRIDEDIEAICLKCLEKAPERRYASASELAEDLRRYLEHRPVSARPLRFGVTARKWARRHPWVAALSAGLALVTFCALVGLTVAWRLTAHSLYESRHHVYLSKIRRAYGEFEQANASAVRQLLYETAPRSARDGPDFRGFEWELLDHLADQALMVEPMHGNRPAQAVAYAPDGRLLAIGTDEGVLELLDVETQSPRAVLSHPRGFIDLAFAPDGKTLAATDSSGTLLLYDFNGDKLVMRARVASPSVSNAIAYAPDSRSLLAGALDGSVTMRDAQTGEVEHRLRESVSPQVQSVSINDRGDELAALFVDGALRTWRRTEGDAWELAEEREGVTAAAHGPDGRFAVSLEGKGLLVDRPCEPSLLLTVPRLTGELEALRFSPDGSRLAGFGSAHAVLVWELKPGDHPSILKGHQGPIFDLAFAPDGRRLASASWDGSARVWDPTQEQLVPAVVEPDELVLSLAVSPDGRWLASGGSGGTLNLREARTRRLRRRFDDHEGAIHAIAFHPDGRWLATGDARGELRLRKLGTEAPPEVLIAHLGPVRAVVFSPDGTRLYSVGDDGSFIVWDWRRGRRLGSWTASGQAVWALAISPEGDWAATGGPDRIVRVWDLESGRLRQRFEDHANAIQALAVSPDGRYIASASFDRRIRLWDLWTGQLEATLVGHQNVVTALAFTPDGSRLLSGGDDRTVRIWDARTGQAIVSLPELTGRVRALALTPNADLLMTSSTDHILRFWSTRGREPEGLPARTGVGRAAKREAPAEGRANQGH